MKIFLIISLLSLVSIHTLRIRSRNSTQAKTFPTFALKHCKSYAINSDFSSYGCIECNSNNTLISSETGTGTCKPSVSISFCENQFQFGNDSAHATCLECSKGYSRSPNATTCQNFTINKTNEIPNCRSYAIDPFGDITCNRCESGFTLSEDYKNCDTKCNIENCDNCFALNNRQFCLFCKSNYIGIYGGAFNSIDKCITNREWIRGMISDIINENDLL